VLPVHVNVVGVIAHDDCLMSGTLADNIAGFDPDLDMQRVVTAAMAAQVHADIVRAPMQYLILVGDMGSTLSGGQPQGVLLARALYRTPKILVLDEGTANLDEENEALIAELIGKMPITRIVVANRPALLLAQSASLPLVDASSRPTKEHLLRNWRHQRWRSSRRQVRPEWQCGSHASSLFRSRISTYRRRPRRKRSITSGSLPEQFELM
jgi:ABC-type protease/lipase transport system fused ATPase/permease subunit